MRVFWRRSFLVAIHFCLSTAAYAQEIASVQTPVLVMDWERLFADTRVQQRVMGRVAKQRTELANENRQIQELLVAEEMELAERRPTLDTDGFQNLADAFDKKVRRIRADQDAKERELQNRIVTEWRSFRREIEESLIIEIMRERGAQLVLDRNLAIIFSTKIDVTEEAIARVGALLDSSSGQESQPGATNEPPQAVE